MMAAFNVSDVDLTDYGYPETTKFGDPMAPLFRSKKYTGTDIQSVQDVLLPYFQNLGAYPDAPLVEKALDDYYKNPKTKTSSTASAVLSTLSTVTTSATPTPTTKVNASTTTTPKSAATSTKCDSSGKGKNTCK